MIPIPVGIGGHDPNRYWGCVLSRLGVGSHRPNSDQDWNHDSDSEIPRNFGQTYKLPCILNRRREAQKKKFCGTCPVAQCHTTKKVCYVKPEVLLFNRSDDYETTADANKSDAESSFCQLVIQEENPTRNEYTKKRKLFFS